jgi:hypothetical protein
MIKENAGLEFRKFQEKFYNEPGILNVKELQKISMEAGKDLETKYFRKIWQYNTGCSRVRSTGTCGNIHHN